MSANTQDEPGRPEAELHPKGAQNTPATFERSAPAGPVFRLKSILVPLDFSDCSRKALQYAIPFAKQFGAELTLLHVVVPYPAMPEMGPVDIETTQEAEAQLKAFCDTVNVSVGCKAVVCTGMADVQIINVAREFSIDLIILSTHGRSGLARVLMGSTAEKVVRHAGCPVLVVRENEHDFILSAPPQTAAL